jgi:excisionase family DNA binding protein
MEIALRAPAHPGILTTDQLAEALGLSPNTVRRWARQGRIPVLRCGGDFRFVFDEVVDALRSPATSVPANRKRVVDAGADLDALPKKYARTRTGPATGDTDALPGKRGRRRAAAGQ